jgi:uncharacterized DUF497 family protein
MSIGFDWDEANISHVALHHVTPNEAEEVILNNPIDVEEQDVDGEVRFLHIGVTNALRCLAVCTTWRGDLIRVITAYPATRTSEKFYWKKRS